jgi:hypothetical protein
MNQSLTCQISESRRTLFKNDKTEDLLIRHFISTWLDILPSKMLEGTMMSHLPVGYLAKGTGQPTTLVKQ